MGGTQCPYLFSLPTFLLVCVCVRLSSCVSCVCVRILVCAHAFAFDCENVRAKKEHVVPFVLFTKVNQMMMISVWDGESHRQVTHNPREQGN